jgi:outer membrane receptor protein involved in Fe transport
MGKLYRTREGTIAAVDTKTQLATLGSEAAPGPLLVPAGAKMLKAIITALATSQAVAADGAFLIRLEGPGLPGGPEVLTVGAQGVAVATGGHGSRSARRFELDIPVTPSNEILIFGENTGEDIGDATIGVTLEFTV